MKIKFIFAALPLMLISRAGFSVKPLSITTATNLNFGTAVQGDPPLVVSASASATSQNATFNVRGAKNTAYTIVLPTSATLSDGGSNTIGVSNFQSNPANGANGLLDGSGKQTIVVGATLSTIPSTQARGTYTGTFVVAVAY